MRYSMDSLLVALLVIGIAFLFGSVALYARGKPWRSRSGLLLLGILVNFTLVKVIALILIVDLWVGAQQVWRFLLFFLIAVNGIQIFFMILKLQTSANRKDKNMLPEQPEITPNRGIPSVATRKWIYGIAVAALVLAVFFKLVPEDSAPLWLDLLANILGIGGLGLAGANTPKH